MIAITKITITRLEGRKELCGIPKVFDQVAAVSDATKWMTSQAHSFAKDGYDKHNVKIEWEDGESVEFRFDAMHPTNPRFKTLSVVASFRDSAAYYLEKGYAFHGDPNSPENIDHRVGLARFVKDREGFMALAENVKKTLALAA